MRVYRGGLLDVGERRMWVRGRPAGDSLVVEPSQLRHGNLARATRLIEAGSAVAVSSDYASEHHLRVGSDHDAAHAVGPDPLHGGGDLDQLGLAGGRDHDQRERLEPLLDEQRRRGAGGEPEGGCLPGAGSARGRRGAAAYPGLQVHTRSEREALSNASAREGLRTLAGDLDAARRSPPRWPSPRR